MSNNTDKNISSGEAFNPNKQMCHKDNLMDEFSVIGNKPRIDI
jgi:hypothetical protein